MSKEERKGRGVYMYNSTMTMDNWRSMNRGKKEEREEEKLLRTLMFDDMFLGGVLLRGMISVLLTG